MNLTQQILTQNDCYKAGRTITPKGIMVHSTGVAQPNVNVFLSAWNKSGVGACVHAFVHEGGVVQTLPWNHRGWHAGTGTSGTSANNTHISFETCEPAGHTYNGGTMIGYDAAKNAAYFAAVYQNAVELCAMLCKTYSFDPLADGVIICHSEGYKRGIASNHADVMHWFPKHGKSMDTFRADVKAAIAAMAAMNPEIEEDEEMLTQEQFDTFMDAWEAKNNPTYAAIGDVPDYWREETQALIDKGALQGDGTGKLNIRHETLRAAIIASRI